MSRFQSHIVCYTLFACAMVLASASTVFGEVKGIEDIIFTGCPPYVEGNHCDSMFYQVVAVDYETGEKNPPGVEYFIVEGPGTINEETGLWIFHPELEDPWQWSYMLEIGATVNGDSTSGEDNCRFEVRVTDGYAEFETLCNAHFNVLPFDSAMVNLNPIDPDYCDEVEVEFATTPEPNGLVSYDPSTGTLKFIPTYDDAGQTFRVDLHAKNSPYWMGCSLYFDVFVSEPIKVNLSTVRDATPGDTVSIDVVLEECAAGIGEIDLLLTYDDQRLDLIAIDSGAEFFSPDPGCGWAAFVGRVALYEGVPVVRMAARARRHSEPICFTPPELPAVLARLQFVVTDSSITSEVFAPVRFYWHDCESNMISWGADPDSVYHPAAVFDHNDQFIRPDTVPGFSGATPECYPSTDKYYERFRQVEYYNGGVHILPPPPPPVFSPYVVRIGTVLDQLQNHFANVDVTLEGVDSLQGIGGFDLLVAYDATAMAFQAAFEGSIYTECGWEYFTFRQGPFGNCGNDCPTGMVRIIGVAEQNDGPNHPSCDVDTLPTTLTSLRLLVSNDRIFDCQWLPIDFYWIDCGDNTFSNVDGTELYVSENVYQPDSATFEMIRISDGCVGFPGIFGAQDFCLEDPMPGRPMAERKIDFINGGVSVICSEPIDDPGDINLNGLAFEIADLMMFKQYFVQGLAAFGDYPDAAIAATDINYDGLPLTVADFVRMIRIVTGEVIPYPPYPDVSPSPNIAEFWVEEDAGYVMVDTKDSLGAVHLVFDGDITPSVWNPNGFEVISGRWGDPEQMHVLVYSTDVGRVITGGQIFRFTGGGTLVSAETATYYGRPVISEIVEQAKYVVEIQKTHDAIQGQFEDVSILLTRIDTAATLGGFDLLVGFDNAALAFQSASEGSLFADYEWEYFNYRQGPSGDCGEDCPTGKVRLVGLADVNDGIDFGGGDIDSLPVSLASMNFLVSNDRIYECMYLPVRFYWLDCGDNVLTEAAGDELHMSSHVYDFGLYWNSNPINDGTSGFPTYSGAQDSCLDASTAQRSVDFINGGVDIICGGDPDVRGDLNLNGLAYEIDDAVMYADYFARGLDAFEYVEGSIAASDVNADGIPLTIEDFVYLLRIIAGDPPPYPQFQPSENPAVFTFDAFAKTVSINTVDPLGAVHFVFDGPVGTVTVPEGMIARVDTREDTLQCHVLVWPDITGSIIGKHLATGDVVSITGEGQLTTVETCTYDSQPVNSVIDNVMDVDDETDDALPNTFALSQNYPNPFNPETRISYALPTAASVEITVYNVAGQKVRTLVDGHRPAGYHETVWDGRNASGNTVSSGIYFYRIIAGEFTQSRKMMLLK